MRRGNGEGVEDRGIPGSLHKKPVNFRKEDPRKKFWAAVKKWSEGTATEGIPARVLKVATLTLIGMPAAIVQGAVSFVLKEAFDILENVVGLKAESNLVKTMKNMKNSRGVIGIILGVCRAVYNALAFFGEYIAAP